MENARFIVDYVYNEGILHLMDADCSQFDRTDCTDVVLIVLYCLA